MENSPQTENMHHEHVHEFKEDTSDKNWIVTIRSHSGLSGDMLFTGLSVLGMGKTGIEPASAKGQEWLNGVLEAVNPQLIGTVKLHLRMIEGICGWHAKVELPEAHEHRTCQDIEKIITASAMKDEAKKDALRCFELLASCEAFVHGKDIRKIHFHEVGALDSILDICGVCQLYNVLGRPELVCSPIPLGDGAVQCQHGILPAPAPAVLQLLKGIPVRSCGSDYPGEMLTPTAAALLKTLPAQFGAWPAMTVENAQLVYGSRTFPNMPNGATFVLGRQY